MKRATVLLWMVAAVFLVCGCSMIRSINEAVGNKNVGNTSVANEAVANKDIGNEHIVLARQKVSLATQAFWKTATAARYIITYLEVQPSSPEILKWMEQLAVAYPQTIRLAYDAAEAVKPLQESERIKYGHAEFIRQERRTNEKMNQLRSMLDTYGFPSPEFGILWDRMEKRALEERTILGNKEQFAKSVMIKDSPQDTLAIFSGGDGFKARKGHLLIVSDGNFLRAFIDKKTGRRSYYVHNIIRYRSFEWSLYSSVNYESPDGPMAQQVTVVDRDAYCFEARKLGCTFVEHVAFEVDEELVMFIADQYQPGDTNAWKYKLIPENGEPYRDGMLHAEVAGFLERMTDYVWRELTMLQRGRWAIPEQRPPKDEAAERNAEYLCEQYQMCPHKPRVHPGGWLW